MTSRFVMLWTVAVFAAASSFLAYLTMHSDVLRMGYKLSKALGEQEQLVEQRRLLTLEAATLRQTDRVEAVARGAFNMDVAPTPRVIAVHGNASHISGRAL
jgi:cell division protein FtsL